MKNHVGNHMENYIVVWAEMLMLSKSESVKIYWLSVKFDWFK